MLESINVRFFCFDPVDLDLVEIDHDEFVDLHSICPSARLDHELHSVFSNGVRQLCLTLNAIRGTGERV